MCERHIFRPFMLLLIVATMISFSSPSASARSDRVSRAIAPAPATCLIYAVDQQRRSDSQFFTINLRSNTISALGPMLAGYNIEGLKVHPVTHALYATSGDLSTQPGHLYIVDAQTGALTSIGRTGFEDVEGLAFRPTDATLWGWVERVGLIQIDMTSGAGTLMFAASRDIEGLAWSNDGTLLYGAEGHDLWVYNSADRTLKKIASNLPKDTETIEMRPDGLLLGGVHAEDAVQIFVYDVNASRMVWNKRVASHYDSVEALAWPAVCGNPSPGGVANMIKTVAADKQQICAGEDALVTVRAEHPEAAQNNVDVFINGRWGNPQYLQFVGPPGPREVLVTAVTAEHYLDSRKMIIEVVACDAERQFPVVYIRPNPYHDFTVDFQIANSATFSAQTPVYGWEFGDGQSMETSAPFVSHFYGDALDRDQLYTIFQASVTVRRAGQVGVSTHKTVTLWNLYAFNKQRGIIQPPVEMNGQIQHAGERFIGSYRIRNLEEEPIRFTERQLEYQFCDPYQHASPLTPESHALEIGPRQELELQIDIPVSAVTAEICGVAIHLSGQTVQQKDAYASAYFELRRNPHFVRAINNPALLQLLRQIAEQHLVPNPDLVSEEELYRLAREGKITLSGTVLAGVEAPAVQQVAPAGPTPGQLCDPFDPTQVPPPGLSCQPSPNPDDRIAREPYIANAKKGDILLDSSCGEIGMMLRQIGKRYSHEGIMTRDRYEVSHSTAILERYYDHVKLFGDPSFFWVAIAPDVLQYSWPGGITQSIYEAFIGEERRLNDENRHRIGGFGADPILCAGDREPIYPLVVKPAPRYDALVRDELHAAAEVALAMSEGRSHYRVVAYSDGAIALDTNRFVPPSDQLPARSQWAAGSRPTVSTIFIWSALKKDKDLGIILEGNAPEIGKDNGADISCRPADGLYCYTAEERLKAGEWLHTYIVNLVRENRLGWFGDIFSDADEHIANQIANCFARDQCDQWAALSDQWRNPGIGQSVSPDDFLWWDAPGEGEPGVGVYGYNERLVYRQTTFERAYRWQPDHGRGTIVGRVLYQGQPVPDAEVVLGRIDGLSTFTAADGSFRFEGVNTSPTPYDIQASKWIDGLYLSSGWQPVIVSGGETVTIDLVLPEPPNYNREIVIYGNMFITDHENIGHIETATHPFLHSVRLNPWIRSADLLISGCAGDEVRVEIDIHLQLESDNITVQILSDARLYEGTACDTDDLEVQTPLDLMLTEDDIEAWHIRLIDSSGWADIDITFENRRQQPE